MTKFGKWIGAGLGWAFGGPVGAVIGLGLGWMFDSVENEMPQKGESQTTRGDFAVSLLILMASVMKADGKIMQSELNYVKAFLTNRFGREAANEALIMLRDILKQEIPLIDVCLQIKQRLDYSSRLELIHLLFGLANADGFINDSESSIIEKIGNYLGISHAEQLSIKSMFSRSAESSYQILGIDKQATEDEIKTAYRQLANMYHPDKVSYLGDDIKKSAEEKFKKINAAYETIKKERGIK